MRARVNTTVIVHLELRTTNLPRACAFYTELFGWRTRTFRTRSGTYVGCWQGPTTPGSYCFNASKTEEASPSGGGNTAGDKEDQCAGL